MEGIRIRPIVLATVMLTLLMAGMVAAAEYPTKQVQLLVGFTAGGPSDLSGRALSEASKAFFPKPIVVVNKPGGGGVVATSELVRSAPDGYTLGHMDVSSLCVSPHLEDNLPYKGPNDIEQIIHCITSQIILAVRADAPWKTMKELISDAKANPGKLRIGMSGLGTTTHLHFMSLKLAGVPLTEVPFISAVQAVTGLLGGHIEGVVLNVAPVLPHVRAGKLKFLSVFAAERIKDAPELKDVPTLKELGVSALTEGSMYTIAAPKGTPTRILDYLYDVFMKAEKTDFYQKFCRDNVLTVEFKTPAELKKEWEQSYIFYGDFIKKTRIREMMKK